MMRIGNNEILECLILWSLIKIDSMKLTDNIARWGIFWKLKCRQMINFILVDSLSEEHRTVSGISVNSTGASLTSLTAMLKFLLIL